ncbi:MAG: penicillin-binding protein 1C [Elusimicrobia bacterium]|nr:penicillin-binding protein 1C [Elusimicrobiota bacterium]
MGRIPSRLRGLPRPLWWAGGIFAAWGVWRLGWALSLAVFPLPRGFLETDYSVLHLDRKGGLARIDLSPAEKYRVKLRLADFSPVLTRGFLLYEDRHFYHHPGVNPVALGRALSANLRHRRVLMGGSTISMQIAKLMEPKPRTLGAKVVEIFRALQLEQAYSKDELLEIYLNSVPLGGNIEGVGAASFLYFGKPPASLSAAESALLVGLPKSPALFRPDRRPGPARAQREKVLRRIGPGVGLSPSALLAAMEAPLPQKRFVNPHRFPHLLERSRRAAGGWVRRYHVDPALQDFCEDRLRQASRRLRRQGVFNGAVLVVDNRSRDVLAYVGSPDFDDTEHGGQVNGAAALRSPGSTLKPFLYARAMEEGLITPRRLVYDIERNYDGYEPANFERHAWGPLTAEDALAYSLNTPAVDLEWRLGRRGLAGFLGETRLFGNRLARNDPGLSVTLGAFPMSLEELTTLYAALADGGRLRPLRFLSGSPAGDGRSVLSQEAAALTIGMMARLFRPDLPQSWEFTANRGKFAYKTGTSFGLRDAWSVGFTPDYTVGVWFGNVNARGSSALVGSRAAAPLLTEIMNELTRYRDVWFTRPAGVRTRSVCSVSGEPVGPFCPASVPDVYIPGHSDESLCGLHVEAVVDKKGFETCRECRTGARSAYRRKVITLWPPEVAAFLRSQGKALAPLPPHNPACPVLEREGGLRIEIPRAGGSYQVTEALRRGRQKLPLRAASQRGDGPVYWYLDGALLGRAGPDETLFVDPWPGSHRVAVADSRGRLDQVEFVVRP